jgi:hypothetical protein
MSESLCLPNLQSFAKRSAPRKNISSARDSTTGEWLHGDTMGVEVKLRVFQMSAYLFTSQLKLLIPFLKFK